MWGITSSRIPAPATAGRRVGDLNEAMIARLLLCPAATSCCRGCSRNPIQSLQRPYGNPHSIVLFDGLRLCPEAPWALSRKEPSLPAPVVLNLAIFRHLQTN